MKRICLLFCSLFLTGIFSHAQETKKAPPKVVRDKDNEVKEVRKDPPKIEVVKFTPPKVVKDGEVKEYPKMKVSEQAPPPPPPQMSRKGKDVKEYPKVKVSQQAPPPPPTMPREGKVKEVKKNQ